MIQLLNKHRDGVPEGAVYIGRPSVLGNPYAISAASTPDEVLAQYRVWLESRLRKGDSPQARLIQTLRERYAREGVVSLVCFCSPQPCHGDVISEFIGGPVERSTPRPRQTPNPPSGQGQLSFDLD